MGFTILGKCVEIDDASYTNQRTGEVVHKTRLNLELPGMQERVNCEVGPELLPDTATQEQWEMDEVWLVVEATTMRALGFTRPNVRAGEKPNGALVIFQATEVRPASAEERKRLQAQRKAQKVESKRRRAERQAEKQAAREAAQAVETVQVNRPA
jgi:hypothetical protein